METTDKTTDTTNNNPNITLNVTLQEVNAILATLQEMPFKVADPLLKKIVPQAEAQLKVIQEQSSK